MKIIKKERKKEKEEEYIYIINYKLDIIIKFIFIKLLNINYY